MSMCLDRWPLVGLVPEADVALCEQVRTRTPAISFTIGCYQDDMASMAGDAQHFAGGMQHAAAWLEQT